MSSPELFVQLPPSMANFFQESGYTDPSYFEARRHTRLRIRCEADMTIERSPASLLRKDLHFRVLIKDISKAGIGILTHRQLWPEEEVFLNFRSRHVRGTIVRCRRMGDSCFECGARITSFRNLEDD